jgi:hypothetical protein
VLEVKAFETPLLRQWGFSLGFVFLGCLGKTFRVQCTGFCPGAVRFWYVSVTQRQIKQNIANF